MINEGRVFTNREYCQQFSVSPDTVLRDLSESVKNGLIIKNGVGRASRYQTMR
ncbi:MAG: DeoR family transcriptional regulator [bacterium]|nr:MAG: DeoR family transcriptional regulator [bacterium]